ncbi:MAG: hypothetical protein WC157_01480 [Candidatus Paceibacterota bacterium]
MINFLKRNKLVLLVATILSCLFFIPQLVSADALGIMDAFALQLDALDFLDSSSRKYLIFAVLVIAESMAYLGIASCLLDWTMGLSVNIMDNPLIVGGWGLMSGIANLVIVLSFVWTGLNIILKGDSAKAQQTLFKLIGVALIVNFSLFLMGALIDVAGLLQDAIVNVFSSSPTATLASDAKQALFQYSYMSFLELVLLSIGEIIASLAPVANIISIVITGITFVTLSVTGWIPVLVFTIILNFMIGSMFFLLAGILLIRICFLWILAITAPLAVVLYKSEIPGLSDLFNKWAETLKEWLFAGVILIFFLGLGFKLFGMTGAGAIIEGNPLKDIPLIGSVVPSFFINYIFLFCYMVVVCVILAKGWLPSMGQELIGRAKGLTGKTTDMLKPHVKRDIVKWEAEREKEAEERRALGKEAYDQKHGEGSYRGSQAEGVLAKPFQAWRKHIRREAPGGAQREVEQMLDADSKKYGDLTAEELKKVISTEIGKLKIGKGTLNTHNIAGALKGMESGEIGKFMEQNEENKALMKQVQNAVVIGGEDLRNRIARISIRGDDGDDDRVRQFGGNSVEDVIREATGAKCLDIQNKAFESPQVIEAAAKHWKGKEFGQKADDNEFVNTINQNFERITEIAERENPSLHKYLTSEGSAYARGRAQTEERTERVIERAIHEDQTTLGSFQKPPETGVGRQTPDSPNVAQKPGDETSAGRQIPDSPNIAQKPEDETGAKRKKP